MGISWLRDRNVLDVRSNHIRSDIWSYFGSLRCQVVRSISEVPRSLPALLFRVRNSHCQDRRDRLFALITVADDVPWFKVDYTLSAYQLFQYMLERYAEGASIDKLLFLGALLAEALQLRPELLSRLCSEDSESETHEATSHQAQISFRVAESVWAKSSLRYLRDENAQESHPEKQRVFNHVRPHSRSGQIAFLQIRHPILLRNLPGPVRTNSRVRRRYASKLTPSRFISRNRRRGRNKYRVSPLAPNIQRRRVLP